MTAVFRGVKYIIGDGCGFPVKVGSPLCASGGSRSRGSAVWPKLRFHTEAAEAGKATERH